MEEHDPVIVQMRSRIENLKAQTGSAHREQTKHQRTADHYAVQVEKFKREQEQTEAVIQMLLDQDTVQLDVPRHVVTDALDREP